MNYRRALSLLLSVSRSLFLSLSVLFLSFIRSRSLLWISMFCVRRSWRRLKSYVLWKWIWLFRCTLFAVQRKFRTCVRCCFFSLLKLDRQFNEHRKRIQHSWKLGTTIACENIGQFLTSCTEYYHKPNQKKVEMLNAMLFCVAIILSSIQQLEIRPRWQTTIYIICLHRFTEFNQKSRKGEKNQRFSAKKTRLWKLMFCQENASEKLNEKKKNICGTE